MGKRIPKEKWLPKGVKELEPAAFDVVRSLENALVIAGPGAGKTELLAQRACYLLETGLCPSPKRILAISFKRDAAKNLADRVAKRVGPELARRFDSMTFDAFAKSLVDRFRLGIPAFFCPTTDYVIDFDISKDARFRSTMEEVVGQATVLTQSAIAQCRPNDIYRRYFIGYPLQIPHPSNRTFELNLALYVWRRLLRGSSKSALNFEMIGRLADLMLRHNPSVLNALRITYGFVFLDEFQDTTSIHYALTKTAFKGSDSILTAVGDEKQKIMVWAGALDGIFKKFKDDFAAKAFGLKMNRRSAPELVRVQSYLINALEPDSIPPEAVTDGGKGEGECRLLSFHDHEIEASYIANLVHKAITVEKIPARQICLLTRNLPGKYSATVGAELVKLGISARLEDQFQDLQAEPAVEAVMNLLKLAVRKRSPESWEQVVDLLAGIAGSSAEDDTFIREMEKRILAFRTEVSGCLAAVNSSAQLKEIVNKCVDFFGLPSLTACFPQYEQGTYLTDILEKLADKLFEAWNQTGNWDGAIKGFEGLNSVPIMTIHKSKGLEYHTVIFIGLEDSALWAFRNSQNEETCAFFVALSRAITRVMFTFCHLRPNTRDGRLSHQSKNTITPLYQVLQDAGIEPESISNE
ncbi:Superfamily I DNA or RNA helicase [Prosthecobacter debontii]|uniref:DNA 3'-5' helicase n=1 Tax=Prosthecobacter debontii TaxID=48467 RepID=A0A1T4Z419_9BACT|nr:ATP-dependent helicase [Prosthecobacter debontii]SKB08782.1 Superfamily I DNA or RNA helicase [Prosthecobacter debontii]